VRIFDGVPNLIPNGSRVPPRSWRRSVAVIDASDQTRPLEIKYLVFKRVDSRTVRKSRPKPDRRECRHIMFPIDGLLDNTREAGLIHRQRHPEDRRKLLIDITPPPNPSSRICPHRRTPANVT
jgi:hypothetical protein